MKRLLAMIVALTAASVCEAGILGWLTSERRGWDFIQQTGGIRIGTVRAIEGKTFLPVEYDVSGLTAITRKPTTLNSGLAVRKIAATQRGGSIVLQVLTQVVEDKGQAGSAHLVDLSAIPAGAYDVFYETAGDVGKRLGRIDLK